MMMKRRFEVDAKSRPSLPGMMLVTVEALTKLGGSATIQELDEKVIELEGVTEAEQAFTMPGYDNRMRVNYYLAWARTYLKHGKAVVNSKRGDLGADRKRGRQSQGLTRPKQSISRSIRQRANVHSPSGRPPRKKSLTSTNRWKTTTRKSTTGNRSLLSVVGAMPPNKFEQLSQRLLREAGFTKVEVRGKSGDGGIDGVGVLRVNLISFQIYFQCKRWKGSVGSKEIRDFRGALQGRADKGSIHYYRTLH